MSNVEYKPAEKLQLRLLRPNASTPWGFRLQGGIDFSTPLSIQSVNPGSVTEACGLKAGDAILAINNSTSDAMSHDEAKAEIMRSGNEIYMLVERGAVKIWKPAVTPLNELRPQELRTIKSATGEDIQPMQKTSLAINKPPDEPCTIGSSHNRSARPFGQAKGAVPNVVHSQYNSPMGLYSANNIADSYSMQTAGIQDQMKNMDINDKPVGTVISGSGQILEQEEQLGEGLEAIPPKLPETSPPQNPVSDPSNESFPELPKQSIPEPPEQSFPEPPEQSLPEPPEQSFPDPPKKFAPNAPKEPKAPSQSAVYEEHEGDTPKYRGYTNPNLQSRTFNRLQEELASEEENNNSSSAPPGMRSVSAPVAKPPSEKPQQQSMRCGGCDMLATGVIVKANGVPYHVACFKCASCSMNLKQKGFFVVEGKLYCETHAKRHAQPPGPDMVAVPVYR